LSHKINQIGVNETVKRESKILGQKGGISLVNYFKLFY